jgi:hypothetical protein
VTVNGHATVWGHFSKAETLRPSINNESLGMLRGSSLLVVFGLWIARSVALVPRIVEA